MTGPEESHSNSRPISVAELLAKNGTIGAPPVGGRRRRRRGDSDSISVAELTGEIPIIRDHDGHGIDEAETTGTLPVVTDEHVEVTGPAPTNGVLERDVALKPETVDERRPEPAVGEEYASAVADFAAHVEDRETDVDLDFFAPPRRSNFASRRMKAAGGAERMSPDPVGDNAALASQLDQAEPAEVDEDVVDDSKIQAAGRPSYMRSTAGPLFGGQSVADDLARRGPSPRPEDIDLDDDDVDTEQPAMSSFLRAAWVVGQCVLAVAFGAGLFIAFDQLWKWNNIVALVLSVLVILGLVVGVRVVRKTEDIGSTLIAVAVGALVTLGPLALLQSG
ncbi:MAG: hypothetical protein QOD39_4840 [Mycobacterium sp.]|jgi:hypothetical protein|nr:hypothetical protein [Mycobacterium sp.]